MGLYPVAVVTRIMLKQWTDFRKFAKQLVGNGDGAIRFESRHSPLKNRVSIPIFSILFHYKNLNAKKSESESC